MNQKKKEVVLDKQVLKDSVAWHIKQGHKLVPLVPATAKWGKAAGKAPGTDSGGLLKGWEQTEGYTQGALIALIDAGECEGVGWVLGAHDCIMDVDNKRSLGKGKGHERNTIGAESLQKLKEAGVVNEDTYIVVTSFGGYHFAYTTKDSLKRTREFKEAYPQIDILGQGHQVVIEGSLHRDREYVYRRAPSSADKIGQIPSAFAGLLEKLDRSKLDKTEFDPLEDFFFKDSFKKLLWYMQVTEAPDDHDTWMGLMMATRNIAYLTQDVPDAVEIAQGAFQEWCERADSFNGEETTRQVESTFSEAPVPSRRERAGFGKWQDYYVSSELSVSPTEAEGATGPLLSVIKPMGEWFAVERDPVVYRMGEFWPDAGFVTIAAPPGVGKTWTLMDLAVAMTTGRKWLDTYEVKAPLADDETFLILDGEMAPNLLAGRWEKFLGALKGKQRERFNRQVMMLSAIEYQLASEKTIDLASADWRNVVEKLCIRFNTKILALDTRAALFMDGMEENSNDGVVVAANQWFSHMRGLGIMVVLAGHTSHTGKLLAGGSKWRQATDGEFSLEAIDHDGMSFTMRSVKSRHRDPSPAHTNVSLIDTGKALVITAVPDEPANVLNHTNKLVLQAISTLPKSSLNKIATELDVGREVVRTAKQKLVAGGYLEEGSGWRLTAQGREALELEFEEE